MTATVGLPTSTYLSTTLSHTHPTPQSRNPPRQTYQPTNKSIQSIKYATMEGWQHPAGKLSTHRSGLRHRSQQASIASQGKRYCLPLVRRPQRVNSILKMASLLVWGMNSLSSLAIAVALLARRLQKRKIRASTISSKHYSTATQRMI